MNVFISWSGYESHKVALALRDWLPSVIQAITPYVSSEDIYKGDRWSIDLAKELANSSFGIICVTKENIKAPWLNFEAGALSKSIDVGRVCPFLYNVKNSDISGPLVQFQSTVFDKSEVLKLIKSINNSCDNTKIDEPRLEKTFNALWNDLCNDLEKIVIPKPTQDAESKTKFSNEKILEEILELSRNTQRILRNPEETSFQKLYHLAEVNRYYSQSNPLFLNCDESNEKYDLFIEYLFNLKIDNIINETAYKKIRDYFEDSCRLKGFNNTSRVNDFSTSRNRIKSSTNIPEMEQLRLFEKELIASKKK